MCLDLEFEIFCVISPPFVLVIFIIGIFLWFILVDKFAPRTQLQGKMMPCYTVHHHHNHHFGGWLWPPLWSQLSEFFFSQTPSYQAWILDPWSDLCTTGTHLVLHQNSVPIMSQNTNKQSAYLLFVAYWICLFDIILLNIVQLTLRNLNSPCGPHTSSVELIS